MNELRMALENQNNEFDLVFDSSKVEIREANPQARITSAIICTPGCGDTGSFNSFCC